MNGVFDDTSLKDLALLLIGFLLSALFFLRQKREREPYWVRRSWPLIKDHSSNYGDLEIKYKGRQIKNFGLTILGFWNGGRQTIRREDIPNTTPLQIRLPEQDCLRDVKVQFQTNPGNNVTIDQTGADVTIAFDYLDYQQGFVIYLTHSLPEDKQIGFDAVIVGGMPLKRVYLGDHPLGLPMRRDVGVMMFLLLAMAVVSLPRYLHTQNRTLLWLSVILPGVLTFLAFIKPKWLLPAPYPKEFRKYFFE